MLPGKSTGQIKLYDMSSGQLPVSGNQISERKFEWFYHRVRWFDVNGDGLQDIVTARAIDPLIYGQATGELIWYENPGNDGYPEVVAAQYFTKKLVLYQTSDWNGGSVKSRIIDDTIGPV